MRKAVEITIEEAWENLSEGERMTFLREEIDGWSSDDLVDVVKRRFPPTSAWSIVMFRRFVRECGFECLLKGRANNG